MHSDLRTTPQAICSVGQTVDGRAITDKDLDDIVATYDYEKYGARINLDHEGEWSGWAADFFYNINLNGGMLGDVISVTDGKNSAGIRCLYAVLAPNASLITLNQADQAVYYSIEIDRDFMESGQTYLVGLAMTDYPASTYTTRANFTKAKPSDRILDFALNLSLPALNPAPPEKSFSFRNLFKFSQDSDMKKEDLAAALKDALGEPLAQFSQGLEENTKAIAELNKLKTEDVTDNQEPSSNDETSSFSAQQESRIEGIEQKLSTITESLGKMTTEFQKALGQESDDTTDAEDEQVNNEQFKGLM